MTGKLPPVEMEPEPVADIGDLLDQTIRDHNVRIPLAIESGSRAWGFPSPDSDYDCRFVFVRQPSETFTLFPQRDVIEHPVSPLIDVSGWELGKALRLLLRGNAVIIEWLTSPYTYRQDETFRAAFLLLAERVADRNLIGRHYFHLAEGQAVRILSNPESAPLKKIFYVLRPLMALRWLVQHPEHSVAPMNFHQLCDEVDLPNEPRIEIAAMLERKAVTREMGVGPVPGAILAMIHQELNASEKWRYATAVSDAADGEKLVDEFWRVWVSRLASV